MKRAGHLMDRITDMDNLRLAYWKAKRGHGNSNEVLRFSARLEEGLTGIQKNLLVGTLPEGKTHMFRIFDPKEREIVVSPFSHRVLHHAIFNICDHYFERKQIFHSYANRRGKGTVAALRYAQKAAANHEWYLKLDVKKYFASISHAIVQKQLSVLFKDPGLLHLFESILSNYHCQTGRGLAIGNLSSQYIANHHLSVLDHFVLEHLRPGAYVRYMDDIIIWHRCKSSLKLINGLVHQFLERELDLQFKPFVLNRTSNGVSFLGYAVHSDKINLNIKSRKRFRKKLAKYTCALESQIINQQKFAKCTNAMIAFTNVASSIAFRRKSLQRYEKDR